MSILVVSERAATFKERGFLVVLERAATFTDVLKSNYLIFIN